MKFQDDISMLHTRTHTHKHTNTHTDKPKPICPPLFQSWGHNKSKIRWNKCDLQLYSDILQTGLQRIEDKQPKTLLDIDLTAVALNKILYDVSAASTPKKRMSGVQKKKNRLPVWNERIEAAVRLSKGAHEDWKDAGCPRDAASPLQIKKKTARRLIQKTVRQYSYFQMQDKYTEVMLAKVMDTRIFYKLVNQQRSAAQEHCYRITQLRWTGLFNCGRYCKCLFQSL